MGEGNRYGVGLGVDSSPRPFPRSRRRGRNLWERLTQGDARQLALPWAIFFRAFSPFSLSFVTSAATATIRVRS